MIISTSIGTFQIRRANRSDDVYTIARLFYATDPHIFTYWFDDNELEGVEVISRLIATPGSLFHYYNLYLAISVSSGEIIGVLLDASSRSDLSYDYAALRQVNARYGYTVDRFLAPLVEGILKDSAETTNIVFFCIHQDYRHQGIGNKFLGAFLAMAEENGYTHFELCCLADNQPALALYRKYGFYELFTDIAFVGDSIEIIPTVILARDTCTD